MSKQPLGYRFGGFYVLWALVFLSTFAISMASTPLIYFTGEFVTPEGATPREIEEATAAPFAIILALGSAGLMLGNLLGGFAADAVGRKKVIFASFIFLAVGFAIFSAASSVYWLFLASFVEMLASGLSGPAFRALVADYTSQRSRGTAYGVYNLSWITAQIPAPFLGGVIAKFWTLRTPYLVALSFAIIVFILSYLVVEPAQTTETKESVNDDNGTSHTETAKSFMGVIAIFGLMNLLNGLANGIMTPSISMYVRFRLSADPVELGLISSLGFGVVTALIQIPGGKLADKVGRKPLALISFLGAPGVFGLAFTRSILQFILVLGATCAIGNLSGPAFSAWLMDLSHSSKRARTSGIMGTLFNFGMTAGPVLGSLMWNYSKPNATLPFGAAALIFIATLPLVVRIKENAGSRRHG